MNCPACQAENPSGAEVCFHCRTVLAPITRGTVVGGRYEVRRPLGRGGMGTVYEAHDRVLDEEVALKVLRAELAESPGMADRLRSEIKLARQVSHPNVCRIHEYGEDGSLRFLSMERVRGTNLKELLRQRGPLPEAEAIDVALQAADGLAAIHEKGVIHRDLKTLNLTVDDAGRVRVMDFGIATRAGDGGGPTGSGYVVGSPEYMSPEQARGRPLDFRSDVYALGIVLYELLTGRVPFRGETPVETLLMHLESPPPLDGAAGVAIPPRLVPVLRRALAKDPRERYASGSEMAAALRAVRSGGSAEGRPPRPIAAVALAAVVLVAATIFVATRRSPHSSAEPSPLPSTGPVTAPLSTPLATPSPPAATKGSPSASPRTPPPQASARPSPLESRSGAAGVPPATATPEPTPAATTETSTVLPPSPTPSPAATPSPTTPAGSLLVVVTPWADVSIDSVLVGQTPLARIPVAAGPHSILLVHPDYQPYPRRVTIHAGETYRLVVDLQTDGVRRRP
jgi:eukaryotic-like serine/threonine-protein kinase